MDTTNLQTEQQNEEALSEIFFHYLKYWKWFVASVIVCVLLAFIYVRYSTREYNVFARVLIKDENKGAVLPDFNAFSDLGLMSQSNSFDNEIEILMSATLMKEVVDSLNLLVDYYTVGRIKDLEVYHHTPVYASVKNQMSWGSLIVNKTEDGKYNIQSKQFDFEQTVMPDSAFYSPFGTITLSENPFGQAEFPIQIVVHHPKYLPYIQVTPANKLATVVQIAYQTAVPEKGEDIINTLIRLYNQNTINEKNYAANRTIAFIDERLVDIQAGLKSSEIEVEQFKRDNGLTDPTAEAQLYLTSQNEYYKKATEAEIQLRVVRDLKKFLMDPANLGQPAPSNIGLTDQTVILLINQYNTLIAQKMSATINMTEKNPTVQEYNTRIAELKDNLMQGINIAEAGLQTTANSLKQQSDTYLAKTRNLTTQERKARELIRSKDIQESLVIYLLQKQEETQLSLALATPNAIVLDQADYSPIPVKPKTRIILLAAFLIGLIIPIGVVYVIDLFDTKLRSKDQLTRIVKAPFIGEIPLSKSTKPFPVLALNSSIAEKFRILTANLEFIIPKHKNKVIMITSTTANEGKSFFARNLAMSLATSGSKTLIIDLDMRKSILNKTLQMAPEQGIAMYLSNPDIKVADIIDKSGSFNKNLHIIPLKVFPPNPIELLVSGRLDDLFKAIEDEYDYIIVDTPPVGLVSDSFYFNKYVDATIYLVRHAYTSKYALPEIEALYNERKLKNMVVALNGVDPTKMYGAGYGAYGNYGKSSYYTTD